MDVSSGDRRHTAYCVTATTMTNTRERPPINGRLQEFIAKERNRFAIEHNNTLALGFSDITIYRGFLEVVGLRHRQASQGLHANTQAMFASAQSRRTKTFQRIVRAKVLLTKLWSAMSGRERKRPNPNSLTARDHGLFSEAQVWTAMVRLESESWYLFAKILLDEVARGIEYTSARCRSNRLILTMIWFAASMPTVNPKGCCSQPHLSIGPEL